MKKHNPIRDTVTNYVTACRMRSKRPKLTLIEFFKDLESRGPWSPDSLFEKWTKKIRADMEKAGTWVENPSNDFEFVAEYISRLQMIYQETNAPFFIEKHIKGRVVSRKFTPEALAFRMIYLKIRVWGLRKKRYRLRRWLKRSQYIDLDRRTVIFPIDFLAKYDAGEETFRYVVSSYLVISYKKPFFVKEVYRNKTLQK